MTYEPPTCDWCHKQIGTNDKVDVLRDVGRGRYALLDRMCVKCWNTFKIARKEYVETEQKIELDLTLKRSPDKG